MDQRMRFRLYLMANSYLEFDDEKLNMLENAVFEALDERFHANRDILLESTDKDERAETLSCMIADYKLYEEYFKVQRIRAVKYRRRIQRTGELKAMGKQKDRFEKAMYILLNLLVN
jgi:hypothetical protein